jgi:hypothetical protein
MQQLAFLLGIVVAVAIVRYSRRAGTRLEVSFLICAGLTLVVGPFCIEPLFAVLLSATFTFVSAVLVTRRIGLLEGSAANK